ncbi:unnamed protein product [Caenorhabditis angaria]|uniref:7TM GPCR serpentine receptor class x (Srx) domain-containing protein n=1 Tax=Caenorhabditis angaria TaxID=860376 RepID=A0A9P1MXB7_9PELO|nr:unnamed protein product [Caenorhabditis angaria]
MGFFSIFAAILVAINCGFGMFWNCSIFSGFLVDPGQRTSFNLICVFRAISNIQILVTVFAIDFVTQAFLNTQIFTQIFSSCIIGMANSLHKSLQFLTFYLSFNRFIAIFAPKFYTKIYGFTLTLLVLIFVFSYRFYVIYEDLTDNIPENCTAYLDFNTLSYTKTSNCFDSKNLAATFASLFFNLLTLAKTLKFYMFYKKSDQQILRTSLLFFQVLLQNALDFLFLFSSSSFLGDTFVGSVFCWQFCHVFDGFLMWKFGGKVRIMRRNEEISKRRMTVDISHIGRRSSMMPDVN